MSEKTAKSGKKPTEDKENLIALAEKRLVSLASAMIERARLAGRLGYMYGSERNVYEALGWRVVLDYQDFIAKYRRQDIAKAIIDAPIDETWRKKPTVSEMQDEPTEFDVAFEELAKKRRIWHRFARADKLACLGEYSVLMLGFDDGKDSSQPLASARDLLYLHPYGQAKAAISADELNAANERYGLPTMYQLNRGQRSLSVHHTRTIHVAKGMLESDVQGTPDLEAVYNLLDGLMLVVGGSAEMFWRGARREFAFIADKDADIDTVSQAAMEDTIDEFMHNFKSYLKLQGVEPKTLSPEVADPRGHVDIMLDLIASTTRIPKRILLGSERGELASSQDERAWEAHVDARRRDYAEQVIVRPFVDRLITAGVLPEPADAYMVQWPEMHAPGEKDRAEVAELVAKTVSAYINAPGAEDLLPWEFFARKWLNLSQDEIDQITQMIEMIPPEEEQ